MEDFSSPHISSCSVKSEEHFDIQSDEKTLTFLKSKKDLVILTSPYPNHPKVMIFKKDK